MSIVVTTVSTTGSATVTEGSTCLYLSKRGYFKPFPFKYEEDTKCVQTFFNFVIFMTQTIKCLKGALCIESKLANHVSVTERTKQRPPLLDNTNVS